MGAKPRKYAEPSFCLFVYFLHIFLFFYITYFMVAPPGAGQEWDERIQ